MPEPTKANPMRLSPPQSGAGPQDTVLLTDVVDSNARTPQTPPTRPPRLDLSSASLAALGGRYEVLGQAGHGNMGNVYKARDRETGEIVALKLLKPEIASDQAMMERFKNELLFARKITHKNVCRVHEFNRIGGIACTSMEFVEGESLRSVLNRFGGLPIRKAVNVALQICSGLKEAHAQGIVHRDLKPENVMIDAQGNVKIMDFGIARSMEAATRLTGSMVGTPAYMAPEQVSGKPVDYRTDIYSLGLMLYEMFTGSPAHQADTPVAVALKQIRETPPPPHEIDPMIPVPIERAILKCLEKDPSKRFQSVAELEKVLAAPGASGTSPGLTPASTPIPEVAAVQPVRIDQPFPTPLGAATPKTRHISPLAWVLLGASLVMAGLAGAHWAQVAKNAKLIPPPAPLPTPKPPDFALTIPRNQTSAANQSTSPEQASIEPQEMENKSTAKKSGAAEAASPAPATPAGSTTPPATASAKTPGGEVFPPLEMPAKKSARQIELEKVPPDVQQRAEKAFGDAKSSGEETSSTYLWVGRYQREDKAKDVVQRIKGWGLPAASIPRHNATGDFWVVVTGPFAAKRVSGVMQWLEAQGYRNVHQLEFPVGRQVTKTQPD
jgi:serine/threonine protein kinase